MSMSLMDQALGRMMRAHPFFSTFLMLTKIVAVLSIETAATDMKSIFYNPEFLASLGSMGLVMFVLAHEMGHIIFMHELRRRGREMELWNNACDHEINLWLKEVGFEVWSKCYCDGRFKGMIAEQIYDILKRENEEDKKAGKKPRHSGGDGIGDDLKPLDTLDDAKQAEAENEIRNRVIEAATMAKGMGKLPAAIARLVDDILDPVVPWQHYLQDYAQRIVHDEESWSRRNRRFNHVYLPGRWNQRMGEAVIIGDCSGSISNKELSRYGGECAGIADQVQPERIRLVWWDTVLCNEQVFEQGDEIVPKPESKTGCTDMAAALEYVEQFDPVVVILLTDGLTPWPKSVPYPLIVCCTTKVNVPIGEVVRL